MPEAHAGRPAAAQQAARPAAARSDGAAFRAYAAKKGIDVKRATRVKGQKGLVAVEMKSGEVAYFARVNDPTTGAEFFQRQTMKIGASTVGDGTGRGLRSVTASGNLRVHAEKDGVVDNKILSIRALRTGIGRLFRRDVASKPMATEASVREAAYFESLRNPSASPEANWAAARAAEQSRAAATR